MKSCCDHHADTLPHGCNQGRDCPSRAAPSLRLGSDAVGYESAMPVQFSSPEQTPHNWQRIGWIAAAITFALYMAIAFIGRMS